MTNPAMVVLRPGDNVLVTLADDNPDECSTVLAALRSSFPGVDFTLLSGVTGIAVAAPD